MRRDLAQFVQLGGAGQDEITALVDVAHAVFAGELGMCDVDQSVYAGEYRSNGLRRIAQRQLRVTGQQVATTGRVADE